MKIRSLAYENRPRDKWRREMKYESWIMEIVLPAKASIKSQTKKKKCTAFPLQGKVDGQAGSVRCPSISPLGSGSCSSSRLARPHREHGDPLWFPTRRYENDDWLRFDLSSTVPPAPHMTRAGITARRSVLSCRARQGADHTGPSFHVSVIGQPNGR